MGSRQKTICYICLQPLSAEFLQECGTAIETLIELADTSQLQVCSYHIECVCRISYYLSGYAAPEPQSTTTFHQDQTQNTFTATQVVVFQYSIILFQTRVTAVSHLPRDWNSCVMCLRLQVVIWMGDRGCLIPLLPFV